ncbi:hypothetical protein AVEN_242454-1 [Araneus ventricosus]|uniref:Uncharacterized protein n=1 Tax=Araneus ventricosus TaxID=182803 RepID=A0A4Y2NP91_ARAVE|nr:hypothetical protein AVEN_113180-1 [Araneus ventricosus]GBN41111.1 hypothetical protein AVEN_121626-1 [Araneus ventricosus]GBN88985.1 hypothetical protein AVEN_37281-1 [Araneus ventricosus]GBN88993.1 hypothetical protein AVEN_242454-1 [Araneus ventricosus]
MNIIEPIWDALLRAVQKRSPPPRTVMDLWTVLPDSWCELPPCYLQTLSRSCLVVLQHFCVLVGTLHDIRAGVPVFLALQCNFK